MNKQEFIDGLRRNLASVNDYNFVNETISYYENYIESQIRMGKTEEEVMRQLGEPRLIAKSIKATHESDDVEDMKGYHEYDADEKKGSKRWIKLLLRFINKIFSMPPWLLKLIFILLSLLIVILMFKLLSWLAPFIFVGLFTYIVYKAFFGKY